MLADSFLPLPQLCSVPQGSCSQQAAFLRLPRNYLPSGFAQEEAARGDRRAGEKEQPGYFSALSALAGSMTFVTPASPGQAAVIPASLGRHHSLDSDHTAAIFCFPSIRSGFLLFLISGLLLFLWFVFLAISLPV